MGYNCGNSVPSQCLQQAIFEGVFLETKSIVVHAVLFAIGISIILWVKMKYKQYVFSCVFAVICLVITMSYGPLYPYFNGTLGV
jgi:Putative ER transporter, 6TM, N-terminal